MATPGARRSIPAIAVRWRSLSRIILAAGGRARVALSQGIFLGVLGVGVIAFAIWRALHASLPEAELKGAIGMVALAENDGSALLLLRYRNGDANVRALWLFSRNDAVANVAVIVAALLVGLTGRSW